MPAGVRRFDCKIYLLSLLLLLVFCSTHPTMVKADVATDLLNPGGGSQSDTGAESEAPTVKIDVSANAADDTLVQQRLRKIYSEINGLDALSVEVSNSVVTLAGEVASATLREQAEQLAQQIDGVVDVNNQLTITRDVGERITTTWDKLILLLRQALALLPLLFLSIATVVAFWILGSKVSQQRHWFSRLAPNGFIAELLATIVRLVLIFLGIVLALVLLDATSILGTVLGAAGLVGLAVGFAVRDTVENFIASILLSLRNPFNVHDLIEIDGMHGTVARLTSRATILISPDGNQIRIPNAIVYKAVIVNFTQQANRRFVAVVPIDESESLSLAIKTAREALLSTPGVLADPEPLLVIDSLGEAINQLHVHGWINQEQHHIQKVQTAALIRIKRAFQTAGIVMPESVHTIRLSNKLSETLDQETDTQPLHPTEVSRGQSESLPRQEDPDLIEDTRPDTAVFDQINQACEGNENLLDAASPNE